MRTISKYTFLFLALYALPILINAQAFNQVSYTASDEVIGNPERGFYHQVSSVSTSSLQNFKADGVRLILINYSLKGFHNKPISADFLGNLESDFEKIRAGGFKMIVRFAYSFSGTDPVADAPLEYVLLHIDQLKNILQKNSDVILTLQAGFIGTWGEWWNTENFSMSPGYITEENWADRRMVTDALLDIMPVDRMIQLRTPEYKKYTLNEATYIPISFDEAYNESERSRLAHHNDCFVAGNFDYGTYHDTLVEKPYLALDTKYTLTGGETCNPNAEASCENSLKELKRFHWSFLNLDYHQGVLSDWIMEGCYDEIEKKLGYRYEFIEANLQSEAKPGGKVEFTVDIKNEGWANPSNAYVMKVMLKNTSTNEEYFLTVDQDVRKWEINEVNQLVITAGLPENIEFGSYELYFGLKDNRLSLGFNPDYSIQFANEDTWDASNGYNKLNHTLNVLNNNFFPDYTGSDYFKRNGEVTVGFEGPKALKITQYNDNNIVYWSMGTEGGSEKVVILQRSVDGGVFQTIAIKSLHDIVYIDKDLEDNSTYTYRVQFIQDNNFSERTTQDVLKQNAAEREFVHIQLDNEEQDWNIVPPVTTGYQNGMVALKLSNDINDLHFYMEAPGIDSYGLLLNTDNGRYLLRSDSLFMEDDLQLIFKQTIEISSSVGFVEGSIPLADIDFQNPSLTGVLLLNNELVGTPTWSFPFLKLPVLNAPENFKVIPSVTTPLSKVKISWLYNANVEGYIIERSIGDTENYEVLKDLAGSNNYHLNNNLDSALLYNYRMFSYSGIVRSEYTSDFGIKLGEYTAIDEEERVLNDIFIRPNPVTDEFSVIFNTTEMLPISIQLFDSNLRYVSSPFDGSINGQKVITIQRNSLSSGLYFMKIQSTHSSIIRKIIIL